MPRLVKGRLIMNKFSCRSTTVAHKTFHRYTVRAKRGTAQSVRDAHQGGHAPRYLCLAMGEMWTFAIRFVERGEERRGTHNSDCFKDIMLLQKYLEAKPDNEHFLHPANFS